MKNPTRQQLLDRLEDKEPSSSHGYHTSKEIAYTLEKVLSDYGNATDEIKDVEDLYNDLWNECDGATPIYTIDLLEWFKTNYTAVDDYKSETGGDADTIIDLIMAAYCWTLQQEVEDAMRELYTDVSIDLNQ